MHSFAIRQQFVNVGWWVSLVRVIMIGNAAGVCVGVCGDRLLLTVGHTFTITNSNWMRHTTGNSSDTTTIKTGQRLKYNNSQCANTNCHKNSEYVWSICHLVLSQTDRHCLSYDRVPPPHSPWWSSPRLWSNSPLGEWRVHPQSTTRHTPRHPVSLPALAGHRPRASCLQDRGVSGVCGSSVENSGCFFVQGEDMMEV